MCNFLNFLNLYEEDIKNAGWIKNKNMGNVINDTLARPDDNLITNENPNNQLNLIILLKALIVIVLEQF